MAGGRYEADFREIYQHGTLVIWPPDEVREPVNDLRQRHDPASQSICEAHITLTQPFSAEPGPEAWRRIFETVARQPPFEISYGPLNTFLPYPCIYFEIGPRQQILALRESLHGLGYFRTDLPFSDESFVPHMSITDGFPPEEETRAIFAELSDISLAGSFPLHSVAYIRPDAAFRFSVQQWIPLGEQA